MAKQKNTMPQVQMLPMQAIEPNTGQLEGLPANPREIRDEKFEKLKKNIQERPELLDYRSLMVYPMSNGKHIIIGGNMRYRAMQELGYTEVPCVIIDPKTPVEKLAQYTILDNNGFGKWDWDLLANEWSDFDLDGWGLDIFGDANTQWSSLDKIEEDIEAPSVDKSERITVTVPPEQKKYLSEIIDKISQIVNTYEGCKLK